MAILSGFLLVVLIVAALILIVIVLMQDEQGEGLGGIFGGGGAAPVGSRAGNVLTRATAIVATIFLVSLFAYAWINRTPDSSSVEAQARQLEAQNETGVEWWNVEEPANTGDTNAPAVDSAASDVIAPADIETTTPADTADSSTQPGDESSQ
jgi:preprotein translocase subunit SecG